MTAYSHCSTFHLAGLLAKSRVLSAFDAALNILKCDSGSEFSANMVSSLGMVLHEHFNPERSLLNPGELLFSHAAYLTFF